MVLSEEGELVWKLCGKAFPTSRGGRTAGELALRVVTPRGSEAGCGEACALLPANTWLPQGGLSAT